MKHFIYFITILALFSCSDDEKRLKTEQREKAKKDSLILVQRKDDSIAIRNLKITKEVNVGDKTITVLDRAKTTQKVTFENDDIGYYKERTAERENTFLNIRFRLKSKSKSNTNNFFPALNVYLIDKDKNTIKYIGELDYKLINETKQRIGYLEQIFDFQESEKFVGMLEVKETAKDKIVIAVNKGGNRKFLKENVIASFLK